MRNKLLDQIRLIAATMVILIHTPLPGKTGQVIEAISRIAVPLFFMVSGYYALGKSKENLLKSARKTAIMLLWSVSLYFAWGILWSFYKSTTAKYFSQCFSLRTLVDTFVFNNGILLGHLWFLLALLYCYLLYALFLRKISLPVQACISLSLYAGFFVIREVLKMNGITDAVYYLRNFLFVGVPFFLAGGIVKQIQTRVLHIPTFVWLAIACAGTAAAIVERFCVDCCDLYIGTGVATVALFVFVQKPGIPANNVLANLGEKYAGDIYIFHSLLIVLLNAAASVTGVLQMGMFAWIRPVLVLVISMGVAYLRHAVKRKFQKS